MTLFIATDRLAEWVIAVRVGLPKLIIEGFNAGYPGDDFSVITHAATSFASNSANRSRADFRVYSAKERRPVGASDDPRPSAVKPCGATERRGRNGDGPGLPCVFRPPRCTVSATPDGEQFPCVCNDVFNCSHRVFRFLLKL